jgi:hypothetical protein
MLNDAIRQGAAVVRRIAKKSPMELLVSIVDGDPTADKERLFRKWLEAVREDDEYEMAVFRYAFANLENALGRERRRPPIVRHPLQTGRAHVQAAAEKMVVSVILMNLTLPGGKLLRDATFKECAQAGGWFSRVSKRGKPNQVVGKILTEDQLRAMRP